MIRCSLLSLMIAPPLPWLPKEAHGTPVLMLLLCHSGSERDAQQTLHSFRDLGHPLIDTVAQMPYPGMIEGPPPAPVKPRLAVSSGFASGIDHTWATAALTALESSTTEMASIQLRLMGGAIAEVPPQATAFAHRHYQASVAVIAGTTEPANVAGAAAWTTQTRSALGLTGRYSNFLGEHLTDDDLTGAYPDETLTRLRGVKRHYDPDNVFFSNLNIDPHRLAALSTSRSPPGTAGLTSGLDVAGPLDTA